MSIEENVFPGRVERRGGRGGVLDIMRGRRGVTIDPGVRTMPGREHVGFSSTREILLAPSAKRREVSS